MTLICTQITAASTVHATDSLLTRAMAENNVAPIQTGIPKILLVPRFKGAMAWWGKVGDAEGLGESSDWNARDWLSERVYAEMDKYNPNEAQEFAEDLADEMNYRLSSLLVKKEKGIGIHFTAYEQDSEGTWIPELFLITNYTGFTAGGGYPPGHRIVAHRQTFHTLSNSQNCEFKIHDENYYRQRVLQYLLYEKGIFTYNNGHVVQFSENRLLLDTVMNSTKDSSPQYMDQRPLFIVRSLVEAQERFRPIDRRRIGHPCFDLVIRPDDEYIYSTNTGSLKDFPGFDLS